MVVSLATMVWSCSKTEESTGVKQLPVNYQTIMGSWYFKSVIKADGTIVDHINHCTIQRDSIVFPTTGYMNFLLSWW